MLILALLLQTAPAGSIVTQSTWLQKPTASQILNVFPAAAMRKGVGGRAVIVCKVNADTTLRDCDIKSETPGDLGFGGAALALVPQMRMRPQTVNGQATDGGQVTIPVNFEARPSDPDVRRRTVILRAPWTAAPSVEQVRAAYPKGALAAGRPGVGLIRCAVDGQGVLRTCRTARRDDGDGFDQATLNLAPRFRMAEVADGVRTADAIVDVTVAFSAPSTEVPPMDARPVWLRTPTADEALAALPHSAREGGATRLTVVEHCSVARDGSLEACAPVREEPTGLSGSADAAAKLLPAFRMSVWSASGRPTAGSTLNLPIIWDVPALKAAVTPTP